MKHMRVKQLEREKRVWREIFKQVFLEKPSGTPKWQSVLTDQWNKTSKKQSRRAWRVRSEKQTNKKILWKLCLYILSVLLILHCKSLSSHYCFFPTIFFKSMVCLLRVRGEQPIWKGKKSPVTMFYFEVNICNSKVSFYLD